VARSLVREMSIGGEDYERSIIPLRSDISRFSRGTIPSGIGAMIMEGESLGCEFRYCGAPIPLGRKLL
jgi:hypothetical protein